MYVDTEQQPEEERKTKKNIGDTEKYYKEDLAISNSVEHILLEKQIVSQRIEKFSTVFGTRNPVTVSTKVLLQNFVPILYLCHVC